MIEFRAGNLLAARADSHASLKRRPRIGRSWFEDNGAAVRRTIGVHTATAQRLLLAAYYESTSRNQLKAAILAGSIVDDEDPIEPVIAV